MQEANIRYVPMSHGIEISKAISLKSLDDKDCMSKIPNAATIELVMYAMICTRQCLACFKKYEQIPV